LDSYSQAFCNTLRGGGKPSDVPGEFQGGPHGIWIDSRGDIYAGEVERGEEGVMHKYVRRG
jgi:hypothetical protein